VAIVFFSFWNKNMAQNNLPSREKALSFLQEQYPRLGLTAQDVSDTRVTDEFQSSHNGLVHVWIQQQHKGIPVLNGLIGLHVTKEGNVIHTAHRFVKDLSKRANTTLPSLSASKAIEICMANLGFSGFPTPALHKKINEQNWVFTGGAVSKNNINVTAYFDPQVDGRVLLVWFVEIDQANTSDMWKMSVDAVTGQIVRKTNLTQYCNFGPNHPVGDACEAHTHVAETPAAPQSPTMPLLMTEQYNVFALPVESPNHGNRTLVTNPHDPIASPFGWLDTNYVAGPEFQYTRGNNAWAFDDRAGDDMPSLADSPDGGANLLFDFPFDPNAEPVDNVDAAVTNLFYVNNMVHDITYRLGFDIPAGNYQQNNFDSGVGKENDPVMANALDGSGSNNARFFPSADGFPGKMEMFLWNQVAGKIVKVNAPGLVTGTYFGGQGDWGAAITDVPVTAEVVLVNEGLGSTLGCEPPNNDVSGKIVLVDRGVCEFGFKALTMQQAGAVACIICDHESPPMTGFGAGVSGGQVTIPAVWMKKADCDLLKQFTGAGGLNISLVTPAAGSGPAEIDGDFDNGIIVHEYTHGISNRLTGGPSTANCLQNADQMGEGWSDFFGLALTVRPGDTGPTKRGVGSYAFKQPTDAGALRRYPYSTDMSVNPLVYSDVELNPEVHAMGEVWTVMLWDLYWAMVEKYGFDADLTNPLSGNARTLQLVMDGMKLQPCSPGFVDGRNAIMKADSINYAGADTCLISSVFARRGLGYLASQGNNDVATDGVDNFDPIPVCVKELKIAKETSTPLIEAGGLVSITITITNHKESAAANVTVTDELPSGLSFVSASNNGSFNNGMVVWNLGTVAQGEVIKLTYEAKSADNLGSISAYHDLMEDDQNWYTLSLNQTNIELFELQDVDVKTGAYAWKGLARTNATTDYFLEQLTPTNIVGNIPVLRFWHKYNTEPGADAGFLEFYNEDATFPEWERVTDIPTFRNGYDGRVSYGTFALPNHYGFSGTAPDWKQSYIDMTQYKGNNVKFRFRFGTDDNTGPANGYWILDDLELIDMFNYDTEACVTSGSGDHACARIAERGIIVEPAKVGTSEPDKELISLQIQPNPATDLIYINAGTNLTGKVTLTLLNLDGKVLLQNTYGGMPLGQSAIMEVKGLPAGVYVVQLEGDLYRSQGKVVVR
jgi:uncharacterized repeat protein (TIGR01451 family)